MAWNDLSMADRAKYIQLGVQSGVTSLTDIRNTYNSYAGGGTINKFGDGGSQYSYLIGGGYDRKTEDRMRAGLEKADERVASAMSAGGTFVPGFGIFMSIPDAAFDIKNAYTDPRETPSLVNDAMSLAPNPLLKVPGFIDDTVSALFGNRGSYLTDSRYRDPHKDAKLKAELDKQRSLKTRLEK